jgi:hypothetical protein
LKFQIIIVTFVLLPTLAGCDGFNLGNGKTKVSEARECYEAIKAVADVSKSISEFPRPTPEQMSYDLAKKAATHWLNIACKDVKF